MKKIVKCFVCSIIAGNLENKVVLITGGGGAIGGEMAKSLSQAGAAIALSDVDLNGMQKIADEIIKVELEIVETDEIRKFSEPEESDKYKKFGDEDEKDEDDDEDEKEDEKKMSCEDMETKMAEMQSDIESRDNIIMEKEKELEELRKFKADIENKEKAMSVEAVMADVKDCFDETQFSELRDEGLACTMEGLDGWSNKVKAMAFSAVAKEPKANPYVGVFTFAAPANNLDSKPKSVWDRLKNQ